MTKKKETAEPPAHPKRRRVETTNREDGVFVDGNKVEPEAPAAAAHPPAPVGPIGEDLED